MKSGYSKRVKRRNRNGVKGRKKSVLLPQELITEILLRLPVKSLIRFKCVCKSWFSLISDPHFAKSHFELATAVTERIVLLGDAAVESIDFNASLRDVSASAVLKFDFLPYRRFLIQILGSCRGFILLKAFESLWVWNPSTGFHKRISFSPIATETGFMFFTFLYGFGYDPSTDDYLVVQVSHNIGVLDNATRAEFFSLRANEWKEIEGIHLPYMNCIRDIIAGSLLNGAIHWVATSFDLLMNVIVAFDLVERSFSDICLPDDFKFGFDFCELGVLGEFLSLCVVDCDRPTEIWIMKEYKVQSSWTKIIEVPVDDIPTEYFSLICSTKSGDIVGTDGGGGLVKCNDEGELQEHQSYRCGLYRSQPALYTESLLSLPCGSEQDEEDY